MDKRLLKCYSQYNALVISIDLKKFLIIHCDLNSQNSSYNLLYLSLILFICDD